jgi:hypothetical protein
MASIKDVTVNGQAKGELIDLLKEINSKLGDMDRRIQELERNTLSRGFFAK